MSSYGNIVSRIDEEKLRKYIQENKANAEAQGIIYEPIDAFDRTGVCEKWWGKAWCNNLEKYADYINRLGRGRYYVKKGTVLDLKIEKGIVKAIVQGSRRKPYEVEINITPLSEKECNAIIEKCGNSIESMEALVDGQFPKQLEKLFVGEGGLFPTPKEISFRCSCPDGANMCKHVVAVMYGIGVRLDDDPSYFFELRGIDADKLIKTVVENKVDTMLDNANNESNRIIKDADLTDLFGVL